jgi:Flp pilus assembly protein TadD
MTSTQASAIPKREVAPEVFARFVHRGSACLRDGQAVDARRWFEQALSLRPANVAARGLLARACFQCGELEEALTIYESLMLERPDSIGAAINTALVLLKLGRSVAARPILERVVRMVPEHRRAWGYLGVTLEQLGMLEAAEEAFAAGHFVSAAHRMRARHLTRPAPAFTVTLPPPDLAANAQDDDGESPGGSTPASWTAPKLLDDDGSSTTHAPPPPNPSAVPLAVPLLDAALAALLVVPHEATVVRHPSGAVLVGLVGSSDPRGGGFAARVDVVHALAGSLQGTRAETKAPPSTEPFRTSREPFARFAGTGHILLVPPSGTRLSPLAMDADVAFFREDLIVGFDGALLTDLGMIHDATGCAASFVRLRGAGTVVLALDRPFLAFDVRGDDAVTLRSSALLGWIGHLVPEPSTYSTMDLLTFSGEGTILFRAPETHSALEGLGDDRRCHVG